MSEGGGGERETGRDREKLLALRGYSARAVIRLIDGWSNKLKDPEESTRRKRTLADFEFGVTGSGHGFPKYPGG